MNHYALIPAKERSSRCIYKNWRPFYMNLNLVEWTEANIPDNFFKKVILSTDKTFPEPIEGMYIHHRDPELATTQSPINDTIEAVIKAYSMEPNAYLWVLNPTSPFRIEEDFIIILNIILKKNPGSVISTTKIHPFIWKDRMPLFEQGYPRKNTQDFTETFSVENGQFFVVKVSEFERAKTWYSFSTELYIQNRIETLIDIDTEDDFIAAQKWSGEMI